MCIVDTSKVPRNIPNTQGLQIIVWGNSGSRRTLQHSQGFEDRIQDYSLLDLLQIPNLTSYSFPLPSHSSVAAVTPSASVVIIES